MGKSKNQRLTPEDVAQIVSDPDAKAGRQQAQMERIRQEGYQEGLKKGRQELLDWLENAYINDPGRPDRGTPKAQAMLQIAMEASKYIHHRLEGKKGPRR